MLSHDETIKLIKSAQDGDDSAKEKLIEHNMPLIKSIVKRYRGKKIEYDDLIQLGALGIIKAINNFNTEYNVHFSTYAVPMITGEIKRYIRDDGAIKVSRAVKSLNSKIMAYIEEYKNLNEKEPQISEIAKKFEIDEQEVIFIMDSNKFPLSLYDKFDDDGQPLIDRIVSYDEQEDIVDNMMLKEIISTLPEREKKIIILRYFRDKTQSEIAELMGVSQVQISRIESKVLEKIKSFMNK